MNKYNKIIAVFLCMVVFQSNASKGDSMRTFVTNVNSAWVSTNYSQILQVINDRLAQDSNDILALGTKQWYYFSCDLNISNAHVAAHALTNAAHQTGRADIIPFAEEITSIILDIPSSITGSYTQAQIELSHQGGGQEYFPGIIDPISIALRLNEPATNYPTLTIDSSPTQGVYVTVSRLDSFDHGSTNTPYTRVYSQNKEVSVIAPSDSGTNTFLKWSSDGTNTLGLTTNITFTMTTSNITAIAVYGSE